MHIKASFVALMLLGQSVTAAKEATGPLSPKERRIYDGAPCETFRTALAEQLKSEQPDDIDPVVSGLARPEVESPAQWQTCMSMARRDHAAYKARLVETEAVKLLGTFGDAMARVYATSGKLCGSTTAAPVSVTFMAKGEHGVRPGDWDNTWDCVGSPMLNAQRFQYQITVDQKKRSFVITARGYPALDGKLRTLTRTGRVEGGTVKLGEVQRK